MEITSGQAKRGMFLQKMRRNKENVPRFHENCVGTSKTRRVFKEIASGQAKRPAFSRKLRRDKQNAARFCENCATAGKTPHKTRSGVVGAAPPAGGVLKETRPPGRQTRGVGG
ncbi:MAG: hypothetical protein K2I74_06035, partial [Treponemataceae bacterium]|nr:hypothetical protein [Treponemataceae bacterium]